MPITTVDTPTRTVTVTQTEDERARLWHVVIHDDPVNLMPYVTMVIMRVFGYPRGKAQKMMLEVHERGRCVVWTGELELAEMYVEQLHGHQLLASMEEAEA